MGEEVEEEDTVPWLEVSPKIISAIDHYSLGCQCGNPTECELREIE